MAAVFLRLLASALALTVAGCSDQKSASSAAAPVTFTANAPAQMAGLTVQPGGQCSIDTVNGEPAEHTWTLRKGAKVRIGGWVLDVARKATSNWAVLRLDGDGATFFLPTTWRGERPDLTAAFGSTDPVRRASATFESDTAMLREGEYKLILVHQPAADAQACDSGKLLTVIP